MAMRFTLKVEASEMQNYWTAVMAGFATTFAMVIITTTFRPDLHRASVRMEVGQRFVASGDYDRAIETFSSVLEEVPQHATALHLRGLSHDRLGETQQAIDDYNSAIGLIPQFFDAINDRGILFMKVGQWKEGLADFRRLVALEPNNTSARVNYAFALQKVGRRDDAAACLEVIPEDQRDQTVQYLIACVAMSEDKWSTADSALSAAIEMDANDLKVWLNRAIARWRLGRFSDAISDLDQASKLDEDWMLQATLDELRVRIAESQARTIDAHARIEVAGPTIEIAR
jgi:Flp pilus assembly protein TadD